MDDNSEELAFVVEDAKENIIVPAIEAVLKDQDFDQVKVDQWTDTICESTMKGLIDLQKPFKYIGEFRQKRKNSFNFFFFINCFIFQSLLKPSNSNISSPFFVFLILISDMPYYAKKWCRCIFSKLLLF
jgi:hypothetical protein